MTYDLIEGHLPPPGLTVLGPDPCFPLPYRSVQSQSLTGPICLCFAFGVVLMMILVAAWHKQTNQHDKKTFLGLFRAFSSAQPADSENELLEIICPSPLSPGCNSYSLLLDSQKSFAFQEIWLSWNRIRKVAKVMYFRVKANKITKVMYFRVKAGVNFNPGAPWDLPPRRLPIQPRV